MFYLFIARCQVLSSGFCKHFSHTAHIDKECCIFYNQLLISLADSNVEWSTLFKVLSFDNNLH